MSASDNPFSEQTRKSKTSRAARSVIWAMGFLLLLLLAAVISTVAVIKREHAANQTLRIQLDQSAIDAKRSQTLAATRLERLNELERRVADLEKEKATVVKAAQGLEDEMRAQLESKDVTISKLQGKLTVNILDRILFDSGEAVLKSDGEAVLQKIAAILAQHPEVRIHVIGHTDNVPIRSTARSRFASNWELSTARALAAVRFLTEQANVDPRRLGAVGYGEFRPIADNATAEGRARNRRIAITILADELIGVEGSPQTAPGGYTNAPPLEPDALPLPTSQTLR